MIQFNPETNLIGLESVKKIKKKPTGILKDLTKIKTFFIETNIDNMYPYLADNGVFVSWSAVEAIIKKYS